MIASIVWDVDPILFKVGSLGSALVWADVGPWFHIGL